MKLVSDYSDYYDCVFNNSDDTQFKRVRNDCLNKWDGLSSLYNLFEETVPMYGYPDSLVQEGLPMEALVYVYRICQKRLKPREQIKVTLREAVDSYSNSLCVEALDNPDNIHAFVLGINKHIMYFKFKGEEPISIGGPFKAGFYPIASQIYLITYVGQKAVDIDTAPVLKNTVIEQHLSIDTINNMLEYTEET
jgi:hypothetical protein